MVGFLMNEYYEDDLEFCLVVVEEEVFYFLLMIVIDGVGYEYYVLVINEVLLLWVGF